MRLITYGLGGACLGPPTEPDRDRDTPDKEPTPEEVERWEDERDMQRRQDAHDLERQAADDAAYFRWLATLTPDEIHEGGRVCDLPRYWDRSTPGTRPNDQPGILPGGLNRGI